MSARVITDDPGHPVPGQREASGDLGLAGRDGGYSTAMEALLGGPAACVPLYDGIQLCCNRGGLLFSLALARRALALSIAEPSRFEVRLRFENSELDLGPREWPANGDFLLPGLGSAATW
jgi:hypothetical protein